MNSWFELFRSSTNKWTRVGNAGIGVVRVALLFGSVAVALALILAPLLERRAHDAAYRGTSTDSTTTGAISRKQDGADTMRRSVLQASPQAVCIVRADGTRRGAC